MKIRRLFAWVVFFVAPLLLSRGAQADMRVAVVDVQRAVMQTEDGLRAQANLKKLFDSRQQELNKKQNELQSQKSDIEKQSKVLSKEALQKRVDDWQKQMVELQQVFMEYNKELEKKQKEMTDPIFERVMGIVKRLASSENFDLVIDKQTVAYVRTDLDLTDRCIQIYNSGGAVSPSAAAPPPRRPCARGARSAGAQALSIPLRPVTLAELERALGGKHRGPASWQVGRFSPLDEAGEGDLAPLFSRRFVEASLGAAARGALLLVDASLADDPRVAPLAAWIHPHAHWAMAGVLEQRALPSDAPPRLGRGVTMGPQAWVGPRVTLGDGVEVGASTVIGGEGFGWATGPDGAMKRIPHLAGVVVEEDVSIGPLCTIDAGVLSPTILRRRVKLDAQVHVGHNCDIGEGTFVAAQSGFAGSVRIGRGVLIGGQVGIADHVRVGDGARVAAKSGVIGDIPAGATFAGYPAVPRARWLRALAGMYRRLRD